MYKIIGNPNSRSARVAWALEELGQDYEYVIASPHSPEIKAVNPGGKIPALIDGDHSIIDSVAIVTYLAEKHGALTHPAGTIARAQQDSFTQFACDEIEGPLWNAGKHSFALPEPQRVPAMKETARWEWARGCKTLAKRLGDKEFVTGDEFTIPDIILGHCAGWAKSAKFDWPEGPLGDYFGRMQARAGLERARAKGAAALA